MPKIPIRYKDFAFTADYDGFLIKLRTNPPLRVYEEFISGELPRICAALATMTLESNVVDEADEPLDLTSIEGWRSVPLDLLEQAAVMLKAALTIPKASGTGSSTLSSPEPVPSPTTTT